MAQEDGSALPTAFSALVCQETLNPFYEEWCFEMNIYARGVFIAPGESMLLCLPSMMGCVSNVMCMYVRAHLYLFFVSNIMSSY